MAANAKGIIKHFPAIFQHADKNVRSEGSALIIELARWIGSSISLCYEGLKPVQVKELQEAVAKLRSETPRPLRWKRNEQPPAITASDVDGTMNTVGGGSEGFESSTGSMSEIIDAYTLSEPVNALAKIDESLLNAMESAQWKERKEALETLLGIVKVPRIEEGQFGPIINALVKRVADVNVSVATVAVTCLGSLAAGLRKSFTPYRGDVTNALLERCKERNKIILEALRAALDSLFYALPGIFELVEVHGAFLKHKNPQIKLEAISWLGRCIGRNSRASWAKKEIKSIAEAFLPLMDDGSADVREATACSLGALMAVVEEKQLLPFIDKLDKIKLGKIKEASLRCAKISLVVEGVSASAASTQSATRKPSESAVSKTPITSEDIAKSLPSNAVSMPRTRIGVSDGKSLSYMHTDDESLERVTALCGETIVNGLSDGNWKTRLESVERIASLVEGSFTTRSLGNLDAELLVRFFSAKPGWKESNFQVVNRIITLLNAFAEKSAFSKEAAAIVFPGVFDRLADPKVGVGVGILFTAITDRVGLAFTLDRLSELTRGTKNPKLASEALSWMANSILDYGITGLSITQIADMAKFGLANTNPAARQAAIRLAVNVYKYAGSDCCSLFSTLPSAQLTILNAEFAKVSSEPTPTPIRGYKVAAPTNSAINLNTEEAAPAPTIGASMDMTSVSLDTRSRIDLTSQLETLIPEMGDADWKVRKEAMDKAQDLVNKAERCIKLTNGDFFNQLKGRFTDSNKNLIVQALELASLVASACGASFEKYQRGILGPALSCLADNKPQVRQAALKFLSSVLSIGNLTSMAGAIASSLSTDSPNLRRELLTWLSQNFFTVGAVSEDDRNALLNAALNCLQDRAAEVRKASSLFIDAILDIVPGENILVLCQDGKQVLAPTVRQIVETHKPRTLPQTIVKVPKTPQKLGAMTQQGRTPKKLIEDTGKLIFLSTDIQAKQSRWDQDTKAGIKWSFEEPRIEFCDHLKLQMQGYIASSIVRCLFSEDFKEVVSAMTSIQASLQGQEKEGLVANLDLILKYITIRLFDGNPTVLGRTFELLEQSLSVIDEANLRLTEQEALAFLSHLVQRAGDLKEPARSKIRSVYRQLCRVYPASKLFNFLLDGLRARSPKSRAEALTEMSLLVSRNGLMVVQASKHIPQIAGTISDRDSRVRNLALNLLAQLHDLLGDTMSKHLGGISASDMESLQERLRHRQPLTEDPPAEEGDEEDVPTTEIDHDDQVEKEGPNIPQVFQLDPSIFKTPTKRVVSSISTPMASQISIAHSNETPSLSTLPAATSFEATAIDDPLDVIIRKIATEVDLECIIALQRLDEYMADPLGNLLCKATSLVTALTARLHECMAFNLDVAVDVSLKSRLCRYVTNALLLIAADGPCLNQVEESSISLLTREILISLVCDNLYLLQDREQLSRALNILLVKILDNLKRNTCFRILLRLLESAFRTPPPAEDRYPEMVMKCLWKVTKQLPINVQQNEVEVALLLRDLEHFLTHLPPIEWKTRAAQHLPHEDLPLRTVKTIVHELVITCGERIVSIVRSMPEASQAFISSYVRVMLMANGMDVSGLDFERATSASTTAPATDPQQAENIDEGKLEEELRDICSKICSKPNTRAGLLGLYELERRHPQALRQIDNYLHTLGSFFYKYIKRNLRQIEIEMEERLAGQTDLEIHKSRLAQMQTIFSAGGMVGEGQHSRPADGAISASSSSSSVSSTVISETAYTDSPVRKRLESPAAKSALRSATTSPKAIPVKDSTIVSLKERLAKLRHGEQ